MYACWGFVLAKAGNLYCLWVNDEVSVLLAFRSGDGGFRSYWNVAIYLL